MKSVAEQVTNSSNSNTTTMTRSRSADFKVQDLNISIRNNWPYMRGNAYGYMVLNERGKVLIARELDNPLKKNHEQNFLQAAVKGHDFPYGYIVYNGTYIKEDKTEVPIQLIFMRSLNAGNKDTLHPRIHDLAMLIFHILDICESLNIKLKHSDAVNDYYFSGEGKFNELIKALEDLEGKELSGALFNTKGSKTSSFKEELSEALISFIPESCMVFTNRPKDDPSSTVNYDDNLRKKISTPERRNKALIQEESSSQAQNNSSSNSPGEEVRRRWLETVRPLILSGFFSDNNGNMTFAPKIELEKAASLENTSEDNCKFQQN